MRAPRWTTLEISRVTEPNLDTSAAETSGKRRRQCRFRPLLAQLRNTPSEPSWSAIEGTPTVANKSPTMAKTDIDDAGPEKIVDRCNALARTFYKTQGCEVPEDFKFYDAHHPQHTTRDRRV